MYNFPAFPLGKKDKTSLGWYPCYTCYDPHSGFLYASPRGPVATNLQSTVR